MKDSTRQKISLAIFFLLCFIIIVNRLLLPRYSTHDPLAIISWDVFGYYLYLPATFIHHDLGITHFAWVKEILDTYNPTEGFYQAYPGPGGNFVMKYPMGMAIMYSPFYFSGQVLAHLFGYSPDGFTAPYQLSIAIGGLVYTVIGLWFMRRILLHFFNHGVTAFTMLLVVLGTNYFQQTAYEGSMPHNYLFTVFSVIVWFTIQWHESSRWKYAIFLGLLCGLAALIRPVAIVIVLIPLLWNVWNGTAWRDKITRAGQHLSQVVIMAVTMLLVIGLQMLYWKIHSGSWLYYSYEKGEKLEWIAPYLQKVLFSYKKGWLVYTPLMAFALVGFLPLAAKYRSVFVAVFVFFTVHLLIVASWPTWWYGGSFGQRTMVESYLLLALPLGALVQWLSSHHPILKWPVLAVLILLMLLNIFQTWQYMHNIIDSRRMTKEYYWSVFGKTKAGPYDWYYLEPFDWAEERVFLPDSTGYNSRILATYDFETPGQVSPENLCPDTAHTGKYSLRMNKKMEFSPGINLPYKDLSKKDFAWIRASAWVYFTSNREEAACGLVVTCNRDSAAYKYRILNLEKQNLSPGVWNKVSMDYLTPFLENKNKPVQAYFWFRGSKELYIDDVEIRVFELK